jgi:1-phosphofructokinase/tagatose 6-phosphate kinase
VIVTVTLNAAIDRTLTVPNFQLGQRHRASQGLTLAGGKGINVARALSGSTSPSSRPASPAVAPALVSSRS